mgnify:CR=1 FL=1
MKAKVSIITPCYNSEPFIAQAIESVLNQTYQDWEMLICNDCSTDRSKDIILEYAARDERIKFFSTQKSSGSPVTPRNLAIQNATGRFIAFLDSDDIWLPTKLENQIPLFDSDEVAVVFSNYEKVAADGLRGQRVIKAPSRIDYKELLKGNCIGNLTGVYDTLKTGKIYNKQIHHEDYVLWLHILRRGYMAINTNTVEALYRVGQKSVSSDKKQAALWTWNILRNEEKLSLSQTAYYYMCYVLRSIKKRLR